MLGRFHEISVTTRDIRASVEFWEKLGFSHATTGDVWPHPYGVLTDGRIVVGLHEYKFPSPSLTFVRPGIDALARELAARDIPLAFSRTGDDVFNELGFRDPGGQMTTVLEARTYSPFARRRDEVSLCGHFAHFSLPAAEFEPAAKFWESFGFVASSDEDPDDGGPPWPHVTLTSDHLDLALHRPRTLDQPVFVFRDTGMQARIARLRALDLATSEELPRGLDRAANALFESPEGMLLLLIDG